MTAKQKQNLLQYLGYYSGIPEWEQPDSTNPYMAGDKVAHNGKTWGLPSTTTCGSLACMDGRK